MLEQAPIPDQFNSLLENYWQSFFDKAELDELQHALIEEHRDVISRVWIASHFAAQQCICHPQWLLDLLHGGEFAVRYQYQDYERQLTALLQEVQQRDHLSKVLRRFRNKEMLRLIWRDVMQLADLNEVFTSLSDLADCCIHQALNLLHGWLEEKWGTPLSRQGEAQQLVVIAMGKLGARELNLSSDIDLIFAYPQGGETSGGDKEVSNQEFFIFLGQQLIQVLDEVTEDGFVFRVDMRLRPYGQSGALVYHFDGLENYYQGQGREWERYAFIKARLISGSEENRRNLHSRLHNFVYRRYVDYSAVDSLREMKALINREVRRRGVGDNIKLGRGGIREIEFIVQAIQLIKGGKDSRLQIAHLLSVMAVLKQAQYLPSDAVDELVEAYCFLRVLEHRIQGLRDQQTQNLPKDELERQRIAFSMACHHWQQLQQQLDRQRQVVRHHFDQLVSSEQRDEGESAAKQSDMEMVWHDECERELKIQMLVQQSMDETEAAALLDEIALLRSSSQLQRAHSVGVKRLHKLMPVLLDEVVKVPQPLITFKRVVPLIYSILRRSAYIALLLENELALRHFLALCSASPWIADELARQPLLLDELIDSKSLFSHPDLGQLRDELRQQLLRIPNDDLEQQMECLRHFKKGHVLRVAATEVSAFKPLMRVSDYLTEIAEATVSCVADIAWQQMVDKYGYPCDNMGRVRDRPFLIIAYGKMAGYELSYSSDLDLVFLYDSPPHLATDGARSIENAVFFTRLVQRIIHILTAQTPSGLLYEVDSRLRPSGNSGLLVSSFKSFKAYQQDKAWTWEHQALVRSRVIVGSETLHDKFSQLRRQILTQERDPKLLQQEVISMRQKMQDHLDNSSEGCFHLKQGAGGIVDIEFIVQYSVLRWSKEAPELLKFADNIRVLEQLVAHDLMAEDDANALRSAYISFRSAIHKAALQNQKAEVAENRFHRQRQSVINIWRTMLADG